MGEAPCEFDRHVGCQRSRMCRNRACLHRSISIVEDRHYWSHKPVWKSSGQPAVVCADYNNGIDILQMVQRTACSSYPWRRISESIILCMYSGNMKSSTRARQRWDNSRNCLMWSESIPDYCILQWDRKPWVLRLKFKIQNLPCTAKTHFSYLTQIRPEPPLAMVCNLYMSPCHRRKRPIFFFFFFFFKKKESGQNQRRLPKWSHWSHHLS